MLSNKRNSKKNKGLTWEGVSQALHSRTAQCVYVYLLGSVLLSALLLTAITPQRYNLAVGDIAHTTITASKDVVDEISTARQREIAAAGVEPTYLYKEGVSAEVMQNLDAVLKQIGAVQEYGRKVLEQYAPGDEDKQQSYQFTDAEIQYAQSLLTHITLSDYQLMTVLRASDAQIRDMSENITAAMENTLNTTIREQHVNESIQYLQQIIGYKTDMDMLQNVVTPILRKVVQANMVIDQEATEKLREEARQTVEPVIYKQGQNIVLARERVTANQLEMLRSLGMLDDDEVDVMMYVGGILLVLLSMMVLLVSLFLLSPLTLRSPKQLVILMIILCVTLGACIFGQMVNAYMAPVLLGVMMLTGLLNARVGIAGCMTMSVLVSALLTGGDNSYTSEIVNLLFTSFISGMLTVIIIRHKPYRQQVLLCGILTALSNILVILTIGFMTNTSVSDVFTNALWSAGSALIASVLCIALDPIIETAFHLATPAKLLELSNPNHPLLRRLLIEASGTYHHSIIVANLAEAAAESVGANPILARAEAYFHDVGKLKRPLYFKENQLGENPHEHTNPYVSAAIVTAHTRDGLILAQQYRLPQEIQDVIIEHHGDTPVMYFYHKALQQAEGQAVDIADFRYDGKRPQSMESAIIMLADTVEAAVRSMPDPTPKAIEEFIARLVRGKIDDGQLDDAPLTLRDISQICKSFSTVLRGVFHERIEYPSISPTAAARVAAQLPQGDEGRGESNVEAKELHRVMDVAQAERAAEEAVEENEAAVEELSKNEVFHADKQPEESGEEEQ
ncbi:MAG: HDIG domain-containing protein [Eubacteriales bacterium]|nr:HDIG domain-containing protein [Eubacteriales bacterium]